MVSESSCPRHVRVAIRRIHELAGRRAVRITWKAQEEMASLEPAADIEDVVAILGDLTPADWDCRLVSNRTGEAMQVFKPMTLFGLLYVKVVIRADCIVVSFHEDMGR